MFVIKFRDYMDARKFSPGYIHNPTYDPEHSKLSLHNAFWLRAVESNGDTVAMIAERIVDTRIFSRISGRCGSGTTARARLSA